MADKEKSSGGIGFCGLLAIVFITLKLTGHIAWSWWWVLAPLWAPFAILLGVLAGILIACGVVTVVAAIMAWLSEK